MNSYSTYSVSMSPFEKIKTSFEERPVLSTLVVGLGLTTIFFGYEYFFSQKRRDKRLWKALNHITVDFELITKSELNELSYQEQCQYINHSILRNLIFADNDFLEYLVRSKEHKGYANKISRDLLSSSCQGEYGEVNRGVALQYFDLLFTGYIGSIKSNLCSL